MNSTELHLHHAPAPETQRASPEPFALPAESEPRRVRVTTELPSEKSHGCVIEGTWTIAGDVIRVRDPNDDPEYVARRLLRQKCGHNSFYAPIKYPASYH
jgi:hypothetical protein